MTRQIYIQERGVKLRIDNKPFRRIQIPSRPDDFESCRSQARFQIHRYERLVLNDQNPFASKARSTLMQLEQWRCDPSFPRRSSEPKLWLIVFRQRYFDLSGEAICGVPNGRFATVSLQGLF